MPDATILIVDDEPEIANLIEVYLRNDGYRVLKADDGEKALTMLAEEHVRLVILDLMLPGLDGLEVCRRIRQESDLPIIMLSAKGADWDKIMGLSTGADDYLAKPFNPLELLARVKAQLRRYLPADPREEHAVSGDCVKVGNLSISKPRHQVLMAGREIKLTPLEFGVLWLLASNRGRVFSSEEIFERVWGDRCLGANNTVMVHIRKLREKIEPDPGEPRLIKTVWGVGYKIEE